MATLEKKFTNALCVKFVERGIAGKRVSNPMQFTFKIFRARSASMVKKERLLARTSAVSLGLVKAAALTHPVNASISRPCRQTT